jgi:tetratricopeptide (TPR) repeat protein
MRSEGVTAEKTLFLSRAGPDSEIAEQIGTILESAGYRVVLQQWDFANRSFMDAMHATLASGARVVALLSDHYLASEYCSAEWQAALADDPLNKRGRVIVLRVAACNPTGLLTPLAYWDLVPVRHDRRLLEDVVRNAVAEGRRGQETPVAGRFWRAPSTVLDPAAIRETPGFTGRDREIRLLEHALREGAGRAVLHGLGGTGKSSLAREYAWRNRGHYVAVVWLRAETESGIVDGLRWLGSQFVPDLDRIQDRQQAANGALSVLMRVASDAGKPVLLIFDNLEDRALLRTWQPREHVDVLITSRKSSWGGGFVKISVEPLHPDDAVAYLRSESGRPDLSNDDLRAIAEAVGQLPLALSHAAAYLDATHSATARSYLERLAHHMAQVPEDAEYPRAVFATFQEAIQNAETAKPGAAAVMFLSAFFAPDAIPEELFRDGTNPQVEEILGALGQVSLILFDPESRTFGIHRLVQGAIRGSLGEQATEWIETAITVALGAFPNDVQFATWHRCERIAPHARTVIAALPDGYGSTLAARLAFRCGLYSQDRAAYADGVGVLRRALELNAASAEPDPGLRVSMLNTLGLCLTHLNELTEATSVLSEAVALAEETYDPEHREVAASLNNLGLAYSAAERFDDATAAYLRAQAIKEARLDPGDPRLAIGYGNVGGMLLQAGRLTEAAEFFRRAVTIDEAHYGPIHPQVAKNLGNLGIALGQSGEFAEAEAVIVRAVEIDRQTAGDSHPFLARQLINLASLFMRTNRVEEAEPLLREAIQILERSYGPMCADLAYPVARLGQALFQLGRLRESAEWLRRALEIARIALVPGSSETRVIEEEYAYVRSLLAEE